MRIRLTAAGILLLLICCALGQDQPPVEPTVEPTVTSPAASSSLHLPFTIQKTPMAYPGVTDEQIGEGVDKAAAYLIGQFKNGELAGLVADKVHDDGVHALCVYALLMASQSSHDPNLNIHGPLLKQLIETMKSHKLSGATTVPARGNMPMMITLPRQPAVYAHSIRAAALSVYDRPEDHAALKADVAWLIAAASDGAYTYDDRWNMFSSPRPREQDDSNRGDAGGLGAEGTHATISLQVGPPFRRRTPIAPPPPPEPPARTLPAMPPPNMDRSPALTVRLPWDNSNSQYGVLGVWAGAEAGIEVPDRYWKAVQKHWESCELPNGQWAYTETDRMPRFSMTCGGISSLYITYDYLDAMVGHVSRTPFPKALTRGIAWLEKDENSVSAVEGTTFYAGYNYYGLERVGLISGFRFFGTHDWYRELAPEILSKQWPDGSFRRYQADHDNLIETSFDLLFLARGRHPILMNKLRFGDSWAFHPRDLANLARFASHELERPLNWQIVNIASDYEQWLDAPVLYIASNQPLKFSDKEIEKIRNYVLAGGMLFTQADNGSEPVNASIVELGKKLFSNYEFTDLPANHELYTCNYHIASPQPRFRVMSNGSRVLWLHSPADISAAWQTRSEKSRRNAYEVGVNLFIFAAGKQDLRNRLNTPVYPEFDQAPGGKVAVARVKYAGQWDPEPAAWKRFNTFMQWETGLEMNAKTVAPPELTVAEYPLAHVAGTFATTPSPEELKALRGYVESGGVLLLEATGGSAAFNESLEKSWLPALAAGAELKSMPSNHPLLLASADGMEDITHFALRPKTSQKMGASLRVKFAQVGKGVVIYSPLDLSSGLLGANTWSIMGYTPAYCQSLMKNIVLYSVAHREEMQQQ